MDEVPHGIVGDAGDGDQVLDLVQQGLLPLPLKSILVARLVCKHWQKSIGCLITRLQLPYETWTAQSSGSSNTAGPAAGAAATGAYLKGDYVTPDSLSDAEDDENDGDNKQQDDDDIWIPPAAVLGYVSAAAAAATAAAVAAAKERAAATPRKRKLQQDDREQQDRQQQQAQPAKQRRRKHQPQQQASVPVTALAAEVTAVQHTEAAGAARASAEPARSSSTAALDSDSKAEPAVKIDNGATRSAAASVHTAAAEVGAPGPLQHDHLLDSAEQAVAAGLVVADHANGITTANLEHQQQLLLQQQQQEPLGTSAGSPHGLQQVPPAPEASSSSIHKSTAGVVQPSSNAAHQQHQQQQHPLEQLPSSFPFCTEVTLLCRNRSSTYTAPQQITLIAQSLSTLGQLPKLKTLTLQGSLPAGMWQQLVTGMQEQQLQQRLTCLRLVGIDLPQPDVLEGVAELAGLRELLLQASIKSHALQPSHLEALACGTQLESLSLLVYQASGVNLRLNPLMQLTGLKSLEVVYKGIFKDQRPTLSPLASISSLSNLTSLCSSGLASPLLPQPNMAALLNLSATGLTKRVSESALKTLSQCSGLKNIKLEAGHRGIAAVAADQLQHLGTMKQLTCISLSLSKGGLKAGASTQQLMQLSALTGLKGLTLSADHRLGFSTEQLQGLADQWPKLETLRCNSFNPLQGLAGFGAFRGLVALSLKPGTGVGKLLFELKEALQPLERLQRLHLDFRGGLRLDHVEAVAEACNTRLQHLSLNMRASNIGSKAIVDIAQLQCLTSLQLLNTTAATLAGPPAAVAIRSMKCLKWLSVQAAELAAQQAPSELGRYIADGVEGLEGLQELRVWLGFGVNGRQAEVQLQRRVEGELPCCRVHVLPEPEKPML